MPWILKPKELLDWQEPRLWSWMTQLLGTKVSQLCLKNEQLIAFTKYKLEIKLKTTVKLLKTFHATYWTSQPQKKTNAPLYKTHVEN